MGLEHLDNNHLYQVFEIPLKYCPNSLSYQYISEKPIINVIISDYKAYGISRSMQQRTDGDPVNLSKACYWNSFWKVFLLQLLG